MNNARSDHWRPIDICVGLFLITAFLYLPTSAYSWVNFDDNDYVTDNAYVASGLRWSNVAWAFTHSHAGYWIPVTWISHMTDCQFWSLNPGPPHLVNAGLHSFNAVLLFLLLYFMTGALWRGAVVAALFAWHPLHVESVAWLAERKDVLSTLFWLLATITYVRYAWHQKIFCYFATAVLFTFGLMAKPTLVTFPLTLLLLDVWPLGRVQINGKRFVTSERKSPAIIQSLPAKKLIVEKVPLLLISAVFSVLTFLTQRGKGALSNLEQVSISLRLENALLSYTKYLLKTIWPTDLIAFYPLPRTIPWWSIVGSAALLITFTGLSIFQLKKRPYFAVGWFWYLGTMVPMIGFFQSGGQAMADRFTYVPLIGIFVAVVWGVSDFAGKADWARPVLITSSTMALGACLFLSSIQMKQWKDPVALFSRVLAIAGPVNIAHDHLGAALYKEGQTEQAIDHFRMALSLSPNYPDAHNNLATALFQTGQRDEAFKNFREALRLDPNYARAYNNYGNALFQSGEINEAAEQYQHALQLKPDYWMARNNLGAALLKMGRKQEAIDQFQEALKLKPDFEPARKNLEECRR